MLVSVNELAPDKSAKIVTFNANGLRSALRKGFLGWLEREQPDVVLLQEVRADPQPETFAPLGYGSAWSPAVKAGYSGVAVLFRTEPDAIEVGVGHDEYDAEGRVIVARFGPLHVASVYVPSGSSGDARQAFKDAFLAHFAQWTRERVLRGPLIVGGDFNIAHQAIDLKNWRGNQKNSGFLPHERAWFGGYLQLGLRDAHRETLGDRAEYTWWSNRGNAFANDVGWRLDYLLGVGVELRDVRVDRAARLSDHAPLIAHLSAPAEAAALLCGRARSR